MGAGSPCWATSPGGKLTFLCAQSVAFSPLAAPGRPAQCRAEEGRRKEARFSQPLSSRPRPASFPLPGLPDAFRILTLSVQPGARCQFGRKLSSESQADFSLSLERGSVLRTENRLTCLEVCLETPRLQARIYVPCQLRIPTWVRPGSASCARAQLFEVLGPRSPWVARHQRNWLKTKGASYWG